jgi:hypothetical protein
MLSALSIYHGFSRMRRVTTDYPRRSVVSVKIRGCFCSNLACFDLVITIDFNLHSLQVSNRGEQGEHGELTNSVLPSAPVVDYPSQDSGLLEFNLWLSVE